MTPPRDDNDRAQAGELLDPTEGMEEVPPPAQKTKGRDPQEELEELAPLRANLYGLPALDKDRDRELLSLADLPQGYSLGEPLNRLLGGGLAPGDLVAGGAASAGAGKTAFFMQLTDGLALRTAQLATWPERKEPLTPVLILSELSPEAMTRRSLAWLTEERASTFRAGKTAEGHKGPDWVRDAYKKARDFLAPPLGALYQLQSWQRQVQAGVLLGRLREEGDTSGTAITRKVRVLVRTWVAKLSKEHPGREVWPVLVVDPIQRWQEHGRNEVEALGELAEALDIAADEEGWIVLVTSDTNKDSAKGEARGDAMETGASLFRGSYKLLHCADVAFYLDKAEGSREDSLKYVPLKLFKNRYGPAFGKVYFAWDAPTGRFRPLSPEEQERYEAEKKAAEEAAQIEEMAKRKLREQTIRERVKEKTDLRAGKVNGSAAAEDA